MSRCCNSTQFGLASTGIPPTYDRPACSKPSTDERDAKMTEAWCLLLPYASFGTSRTSPYSAKDRRSRCANNLPQDLTQIRCSYFGICSDCICCAHCGCTVGARGVVAVLRKQPLVVGNAVNTKQGGCHPQSNSNSRACNRSQALLHHRNQEHLWLQEQNCRLMQSCPHLH